MTGTSPDELPPIAAAVIIHEGKVLLVKRRISEGSLSWQFPAGAVEPGESPEEAAVRETQEETGILVRHSRVIGQRVHPNTGRVMVYVSCVYAGGTASIKDSEELSDLAWVDGDSLYVYAPNGFYPPVAVHIDEALTTGGWHL